VDRQVSDSQLSDDRGAANAPLLSIRNLNKFFGAVKAVDGVDLDIYSSEIVGLVGDNGAGKSTFLSLLSGYNKKDSGDFFYRGKPVTFNSPVTSRRNLGIEMVYQNLSLAHDLLVWQNMFLGAEETKFRIFNNRKQMIARCAAVLQQLNSKVRPTDRTDSLSGGELQIVAISRALLFERDLIIMDEPTAAISVAKIGEILKLILDLKAHGKSVILVSHRLEDILTVADRIVVFSQGRIRSIVQNKDLRLNDLVHLMFGGKTSSDQGVQDLD
jgi:ABC-type sugar transport system ATPase subunit